jgi:hypothetical protein
MAFAANFDKHMRRVLQQKPPSSKGKSAGIQTVSVGSGPDRFGRKAAVSFHRSRVEEI